MLLKLQKCRGTKTFVPVRIPITQSIEISVGHKDIRIFLWLGKRYGNITFEDDSLDFDISEIDSVYEDEESN